MSAAAIRSRPDLATLRAALPYVVLAAALGYLAWAAISTATKPGLEYDESLFINAAAGRPTGQDTFLGIPTMVYPYIGALKSWLYVPVFDLFGITPKTIRFPVIGVELATVALAFVLARRWFGAWPAALLAVLLATDPTWMTAAKADWGPLALASFLRVAALLAYVTWLRTARARWLWCLVVALALGAWNKLDFLFFAGGLAAAALVVHHRELWAVARRAKAATAAPLVALGAFLLVLYVEVARPATGFSVAESHVGLGQRIHDIWHLIYETFNGWDVYLLFTGRLLPHGTLFFWFLVAIIVGGAGVTLWRAAWGVSRPAGDPLAGAALTTAFLFVLFAVMAVAMVFARQVNGPHHALQLWPIPELLGISLIAVAARLPRERVRAAVVAVLAAGVVLLAASQVRTNNDFRAAFADGRDLASPWTTEVYDLSAAVNHAAAAPDIDSVVMADWGMGLQVSALGTDAARMKVNDAWGTFPGLMTPQDVRGTADNLFRGKNVLLAFHTPGNEVMKGATLHAQQVMAAVHARQGVRPVYRGHRIELYQVDDRPPPGS